MTTYRYKERRIPMRQLSMKLSGSELYYQKGSTS